MKKQLFLGLLLSLFVFSCSENALKAQNNDNSVKTHQVECPEMVLFPTEKLTQIALDHFNSYKPNLLTSENTEVVATIVYTGDITGDSKEDIAIYYAIEPTDGGNYLAGQGFVMYENKGDNVQIIQNYVPDYSFVFDRINRGKIFLSRLEYADTDPRCCPSIRTEIELTLTGNKIVEKVIQD